MWENKLFESGAIGPEAEPEAEVKKEEDDSQAGEVCSVNLVHGIERSWIRRAMCQACKAKALYMQVTRERPARL